MTAPSTSANRLAAWYMVGVLSLLYAVSIIDRQIMPMAIIDIRRSLGVSNFEVSLMMGLAFALFYTLCGLPIGAAVDRYPRRWVIFIGITIWSLAAAACGLAMSPAQLFAARMAVGAGEAAMSPAAYSLMSERFAKDRLAGPISVYTLGGTAGAAAAVFAGGHLLQVLSANGGLSLGSLGHLEPWQALFVVTGLPGVALAMLVFTFPVPPRQSALRGSGVDRQFLAFLRSEWRLLLPLLSGFGAAAMLPYGLTAWIPTLLMKTFHLAPMEVGRTYGLILLISGICAHSLNGFVVDWLFRRGVKSAHLYFFIGSAAFAAPLVALALLSGSLHYTLCGIVAAQLILTPFVGYAAAAVQLIAPAGMHGRLSSVFLFVISVFGLGLGPTLVALLTDFVFHSDAMLARSLAVFVIVTAACAALLLAAAAGPFRAAVNRSTGQSSR